MSKKKADKTSLSNIHIKANIWTSEAYDCGKNPPTGLPYEVEKLIPGDLMVDVLGRDRRKLDHRLTQRQRDEYEHYRFFAPHGQEGQAFDDRDR